MTRKPSRFSLAAMSACVAVFMSGSAIAQWGAGASAKSKQGTGQVMPLSLQDLTCLSKVELLLPMVPGEHFFGMAPRVGAQYGTGSMSVGIDLPMAFISPDEGDSKFVLGSMALDIKALGCARGDWNVCYGGAMAVSAGFVDVEEAMEAAALSMGAVAHQDMTYYAPETLTLRPLAVLALTGHGLFAQLELGAGVFIAIKDTDARDTEAALAYGFAVGYQVLAFLAPMIEFRGFSHITAEDGEPELSFYWLNLGARFDFDGVLPVFRLSIPLNDEAKMVDESDVQFSLGVAFQF